MRDVFVAGTGMTRFARHPDKTHQQLTACAVREALADAGAAPSDIDMAFYSSVAQAMLFREAVVPGQFALRPLGFEGTPVVNVENACASSSSGFNLAFSQVASGISEAVLVVGTEKLFSDDRQRRMSMFQQEPDLREAAAFLERNAALLKEPPEGLEASEPRSALMDSYAAQARLHMAQFGTTQRQLAAIAAKNHRHSEHNPLSQYNNVMSVDDVLAGRSVSWPLTVPMCAPISDGSAAAIVCSRDALRRFRNATPVRVLASVMQGGRNRDVLDFQKQAARLAARRAYEIAGLGPEDVDVVEVHDASAMGELTEVEALGLCELGEGGPFAESGATSLGGKVPVNPSGGLESRGHPLAATGMAQIHELANQLRGRCGQRQVPSARIAVAENGGGFIHNEGAVVLLTILAA